MPLTGYYSPEQTVGLMSEDAPMGWTGTIGGQRMFLGGLPRNATQADAEAFYRNSTAYNTSAGMGFLSPGAHSAVNPNATASERDAYQDLYNQRQGAINYSDDTWAGRHGMSPLGVIGAGILLAAGGAAAAGALGGGGAAGAGAAGGSAGGAAGTAAGIDGAISAAGSGLASGGLGAAGTAGGAAAGTAGAAGGAGALGAAAIPEIVVTGSSGGGAGGAAAGVGGGGSFWDSMHNAASDTSSINAANEQYLNSLEAPTANYGIDWMNLARQAGGALSQGQGQQQPMMGGMPGLMGGGGGSRAGGVAPQRSQVFRSPLERYMAMSRVGLLGSDD